MKLNYAMLPVVCYAILCYANCWLIINKFTFLKRSKPIDFFVCGHMFCLCI